MLERRSFFGCLAAILCSGIFGGKTPGAPCGKRVLTKNRRFDRSIFWSAGRLVEQRIYKNWTPGIDVLCWALYPFDDLEVDGEANPMVHNHFSVDQESYPKFSWAIATVRAAFAEWWGTSRSQRQERLLNGPYPSEAENSVGEGGNLAVAK